MFSKCKLLPELCQRYILRDLLTETIILVGRFGVRVESESTLNQPLTKPEIARCGETLILSNDAVTLTEKSDFLLYMHFFDDFLQKK